MVRWGIWRDLEVVSTFVWGADRRGKKHQSDHGTITTESPSPIKEAPVGKAAAQRNEGVLGLSVALCKTENPRGGRTYEDML
jgi:hypothetical protein